MGVDLSKVPSPCYVLEEKLLRKNLELLQRVRLESGARVLCALKGFAMWSTFPMLKQYLDGATASSLNEARLCHEEMGVKAHLCCPVYLEEEIEEMASISSHIPFNSIRQYEKFSNVVAQQELKAAIRINPEESGAPMAIYNACAPGTRLGVTAEHFDELPEGITGLHFHALCEQNADALVKVIEAVEQRFGEHLHQIEWINFGGGHHITREDYDVDLLIKTIVDFKKRYNVEVILEPGEAVGWQTGHLVSTVRDIVKSNGIETAILDVSFAAHMPDCLEMPYKPMIWGAKDETPGLYTYRMGGVTCLAGDYVGNYSFDYQVKEGDRIVFDDMIHYTMVKTTTFNGITHPSIGIWKEDGTFELVREFGYSDYKERLS